MSTRSMITTVIAAALIQPSIAAYSLTENYTPSSFFDKFTFFTDGDPTHGTVKFVDRGTAQNTGLIQTNGDNIYMGVDHTNNVGGDGRPSVRITSTSSYNHGLIVVDIQHMPEGCGTWPAFWMVGPDWPSNGEIDIIEGVNSQNTNQMTLHTGPNCQVGGGSYSGQMLTSNCDVNAAGQSSNAGCGIKSGDTLSYGSGFNNNGGGVFATRWTSQAIDIWFFPRNSIPGDVSSDTPNPDGWGTPQASFQGNCDIDSSIKNQQIVFDTTFCGDWAGNVWGSDSQCSGQASSCADYVMNNPGAFANAYWTVNSLKIFQDGSGSLSQNNAAPSGIASSLPNSISTLAPIPDSTTLTALSWPATPTNASAPAVSSADVDATFVLPATGTPLTATSWQATDVPAAPAAPAAPTDPLAGSKSESSGEDWQPGDALESSFFGAGSQGIPVERREDASPRTTQVRRRHIGAHRAGARRGMGHSRGSRDYLPSQFV